MVSMVLAKSIYDVVLNGYNGAPSYATEHAFTYVERPRMVDNSQHNTNVSTRPRPGCSARR